MAITILSEHGTLPAAAIRLAEILNDYDETLELRWIPPEVRTGFDDAPFAVWQVAPGFPPYMVMPLKENQLDHRVLAALFNANNANGSALDRLEAEEAAKQAFNLKAKLEAEEEAKEFAVWALKQNKTVKHNGAVYR